MRKAQFSAGTIIFSQGDTSKEIYILNKGIIEVMAEGNVVARITQRGTFFGEMAAILREERNATLRAQTDCDCIILYEQYINAIIKSAPEIGFSLVRILARRLKLTTTRLAKVLGEGSAQATLKNPYQLMIAIGMLSKENLTKAITAMRNEDNTKPLLDYLKRLSDIEEEDMNRVFSLFKKYQKS